MQSAPHSVCCLFVCEMFVTIKLLFHQAVEVILVTLIQCHTVYVADEAIAIQPEQHTLETKSRLGSLFQHELLGGNTAGLV